MLLDTLVNPGVPITDGTRWLHGISNTNVADAPLWPEVLPKLVRVTASHQLLAYKAEFDVA